MVNKQSECYKHPDIIREVFNSTNRVASLISNTARLENDILNDIGIYLLKDPDNYRKRRYIRRIIHSKISVAKRRNRREHAEHLADLTSSNEEGQAVEYEPEDVLANVNSRNLEFEETITLLAKDDRRREIILNAWADGYTDDTEISHILADVLTGKSTGHLSFIKRFRKECRAGLTAQAI